MSKQNNNVKSYAAEEGKTGIQPVRFPCYRSEHQRRIDEFMEKAGQALPTDPILPAKEVLLLRARLILEEALETVQALGFMVGVEAQQTPDGTEKQHVVSLFAVIEPNLIEIADGCADISVVTIGTLSACGISDNALLEIVDASNLAKFAPPKCPDCGLSMELSSKKDKWICTMTGTFDSSHTRPLKEGPHRREDGKWMKPPDWTKPDIAGLLEQMKNR